MIKSPSGKRRSLGAMSSRSGTFSAEELAKLGRITSPALVHSRIDYPVSAQSPTPYPEEGDLKRVIAKELASRTNIWREMARKFPEEPGYESIAWSREELCNQLMAVQETHPAFARCWRAWFKPHLGPASFLDRLELQTGIVQVELYKLTQKGSKRDVYKFYESLARELEKV
jgi:hypothetical protein